VSTEHPCRHKTISLIWEVVGGKCLCHTTRAQTLKGQILKRSRPSNFVYNSRVLGIRIHSGTTQHDIVMGWPPAVVIVVRYVYPYDVSSILIVLSLSSLQALLPGYGGVVDGAYSTNSNDSLDTALVSMPLTNNGTLPRPRHTILPSLTVDGFSQDLWDSELRTSYELEKQMTRLYHL
jgi:hypothetical protein